MFEVLDGRVTVHTTAGHIDARGKLQGYQEKVNPVRFFESARGYLINLQHVSADNDRYITFDNGCSHARLSRRRRRDFRMALSMYLNSIEVYE